MHQSIINTDYSLFQIVSNDINILKQSDFKEITYLLFNITFEWVLLLRRNNR